MISTESILAITMTLVLQVLNHYIDCLSKGQTLFQRRICFHVANASRIKTLEVELPANGNLVPLFTAFGLISAAELNTQQLLSGTGCSMLFCSVVLAAMHAPSMCATLRLGSDSKLQPALCIH